MAVGKKTGGRKKGTPNKRTQALAVEAVGEGETPLAYLLGVMRDMERDVAVRLEAAKAAAPYVHAKLASIEHSGNVGISHEEALGELE